MINFEPLYQFETSTLLLAPTAWGKTTLLLKLSLTNKLVYISPLRALGDEFEKRCKSEKIKVSNWKNSKKIDDNQITIIAAESVNINFLIKASSLDAIYIFDEFHLFYYWGKSFREKLLESIVNITYNKSKTLCLTATASDDVITFWKELSSEYDKSYLINVGNHKIRTNPNKCLVSLSKTKLLKTLEIKSNGVTLVFCKYRSEVYELRNRFVKNGFVVNTCVSGDVDNFNRRLEKELPDIIIATSTLSHGVNLPSLVNVYITYKVPNRDMFLQMIGRAGRNGEDFNIFITADNFRNWKYSVLSLVTFLCHYYKSLIKGIFGDFRGSNYSQGNL